MRKQVFISYFHGDQDIVRTIAAAFEQHGVRVWVDFDSLRPGDFIARHIEEGIRASSYFTIVVSSKSVNSRWVQAELAMAFDFAKDGRLIIVPAKADQVEMPLELRGLMYIDFSKSIDDGTMRLARFLQAEDKKASNFFSAVRGSPLGVPNCEHRLLSMEIADLRFDISRRLTKDELSVIWFDVFEAKMDSEINPASTGVIASELIFRAQTRRKMDRLIRYLCRERPDLQDE